MVIKRNIFLYLFQFITFFFSIVSGASINGLKGCSERRQSSPGRGRRRRTPRTRPTCHPVSFHPDYDHRPHSTASTPPASPVMHLSLDTSTSRGNGSSLDGLLKPTKLWSEETGQGTNQKVPRKGQNSLNGDTNGRTIFC